MTPQEILNLPMPDFDFDEDEGNTIRDYLKLLLKLLLSTLWSDGESFSGKRPFGNSGWEYDLYNALITGGAIKGKVEDGCVEELSDLEKFKANQLIFLAIETL